MHLTTEERARLEAMYADPDIHPDWQCSVTVRTLRSLLAQITALEQERDALRRGLEKIANPIAWMQDEAKRKGQTLDGTMAMLLAKDAGWLQSEAAALLTELRRRAGMGESVNLFGVNGEPELYGRED